MRKTSNTKNHFNGKVPLTRVHLFPETAGVISLDMCAYAFICVCVYAFVCLFAWALMLLRVCLCLARICKRLLNLFIWQPCITATVNTNQCIYSQADNQVATGVNEG